MIYMSPEGEYPKHYGDIMLASPGWKKGNDLPDGWRIVEMTEPPQLGEYEVYQRLEPIEVDGVLYEAWDVRPMTDAERERVDAPKLARQKLTELGFTDLEIQAISRGL